MSKKQTRIVLENPAQEALERMLFELKGMGSFVKISPSRLISSIVLHFEKGDFLKQKEELVRGHIDAKRYLKSIAGKLNESENLESVLKKALKQIKPQREKLAKKTS